MITPSFTGFNPYIFKAYYDYIVDNEDIPHLLVNPKYKGVVLPKQFTSTEELVLSISPAATHDFFIGKSGLSFDTRFSGKTFSVYLPYGCIQELIATESKIAIPIRVFFVPSEEEAGQENDSEGPGFEIMDEDDTPVSLDTSKEEPLKDKSSSPVTPEIEGSDLKYRFNEKDEFENYSYTMEDWEICRDALTLSKILHDDSLIKVVNDEDDIGMSFHDVAVLNGLNKMKESKIVRIERDVKYKNEYDEHGNEEIRFEFENGKRLVLRDYNVKLDFLGDFDNEVFEVECDDEGYIRVCGC